MAEVRENEVRIAWKRRCKRQLSRTLRPVEAWARTRLLLAADRIALRARSVPQADRVLIVRLDNIGDFVVWLDAAEALVQSFHAQGKHVTLLANAVWKGWAEELGLFDEVLGIEEKRFRRDMRYRWKMAREIRLRGFGTAVQPSFTRILEGGDAILRLSGATDRIGQSGTFEQGCEGHRRMSDRWYTNLLTLDVNLGGEMQRNAAFVRALTGSDYRAKVANLRARMDTRLPDDLVAELEEKPYFVLFPGATFAGRLWPAERYVELAQRIHAATGALGVICGGRTEETQAAGMMAAARSPLRNWVGRTTLPGLAAVLAEAELLVANETSAIHIAAAVGTPSVCIVGGGHYGRFMPYDVEEEDGRPLPVTAVRRMGCFGCNWRCVYHPPAGTPVPCIEQLGVEDVGAAVRLVLHRGEDRTTSAPSRFTALQCP